MSGACAPGNGEVGTVTAAAKIEGSIWIAWTSVDAGNDVAATADYVSIGVEWQLLTASMALSRQTAAPRLSTHDSKP
jgi:hypothetical protein